MTAGAKTGSYVPAAHHWEGLHPSMLHTINFHAKYMGNQWGRVLGCHDQTQGSLSTGSHWPLCPCVHQRTTLDTHASAAPTQVQIDHCTCYAGVKSRWLALARQPEALKVGRRYLPSSKLTADSLPTCSAEPSLRHAYSQFTRYSTHYVHRGQGMHLLRLHPGWNLSRLLCRAPRSW